MLRKFRFYYLLFLTYTRKNLRDVLRFAVFLILIIAFFNITFAGFWQPLGNKFVQAIARTSYSEALVGTAKSLNPLFETTRVEKEINGLVFRGLTKVGSDGKITTDLAESYQVLNGTEYIFKLRRDVLWHDGEKFNADDVVYTLRQVQDPNLATNFRTSFKDVSVEKIDDYTVRFDLKEPFAPFLSQTTLGIIPQHISLKNYRPIGTGEFRVSSFSPEKIVVTNSRLDLVFKIYSSGEKALLALKQGDVEALGDLSRSSVEELKSWPNLQIFSKNLPTRVVAVFFNTRADFVSDKMNRQALALATPKEEILKIAQYGSKIASGPLSNNNSLSIQMSEKYSFDLTKASSILNSAGWKLENGKRVKSGKNLSLSLTIPREPQFEAIAGVIGKSWKKLGVDFQVIELNSDDFKEALRRTQFQAILTTEEIGADPDQYVVWHSTQVAQGNITALSSPKVDKLLEDARKSNDIAVRRDKYSEFVRILADESPAIFLYSPGYNWVVNKRIKNIRLGDLMTPSDRFNSASQWQIPKITI